MNNEDIKSVVSKDGLDVSYLMLACCIFICSGFAYWLYTDSNIQKLRDYRFGYNRLIVFERLDDANKFRSETIASIFDDEIDLMWLPVIRSELDGYEKLQFYSRLLAGNPDHEIIYRDIADIMDAATEEYSIKDRTRYLTALKEITGVHDVLLEKYGLLAPTTPE
ncbi:MAG: hypothetical protein O7D86_13820 [Proteobacteria bacterium]|nr:hypothetical protein [Pseudomonadota bacterium]